MVERAAWKSLPRCREIEEIFWKGRETRTPPDPRRLGASSSGESAGAAGMHANVNGVRAVADGADLAKQLRDEIAEQRRSLTSAFTRIDEQREQSHGLTTERVQHLLKDQAAKLTPTSSSTKRLGPSPTCQTGTASFLSELYTPADGVPVSVSDVPSAAATTVAEEQHAALVERVVALEQRLRTQHATVPAAADIVADGDAASVTTRAALPPAWEAPAEKYSCGVLHKYSKLVNSASEGATLAR